MNRKRTVNSFSIHFLSKQNSINGLLVKNGPILCTFRPISLKCTKKGTRKFLFSDPPGARTQDPNIKSVVLYLLS